MQYYSCGTTAAFFLHCHSLVCCATGWQVFHQGLDEFTMMCKMVQKLYSQYLGKGWTHEQLPGILAVAEQQEKQEQADDNDDSSEKVDPDTSKVCRVWELRL